MLAQLGLPIIVVCSASRYCSLTNKRYIVDIVVEIGLIENFAWIKSYKPNGSHLKIRRPKFSDLLLLTSSICSHNPNHLNNPGPIC